MRLKKHKFTIESLVVSAREHIGRIIDTMTFEDVIDITAAIGLTTVIHEAVKTLPNVVKTLSTLTYVELGNILGSGSIVSSFGAFIGVFMADLFKQWITPPPKEEPKPQEDQLPMLLGWLLSFAIAWIIVKWGDKMIVSGIGNLSGIIKLLGI
jgi:hypothetical protein